MIIHKYPLKRYCNPADDVIMHHLTRRNIHAYQSIIGKFEKI